MKFEELRKEHIVFSYRIGPDTGIEGDDGGFSIELYGNGNLRYCRYQLFDEVVGIEMYKLTKEQVRRIYDVIMSYEEKLERIPTCLECGRKKELAGIPVFRFWKDMGMGFGKTHHAAGVSEE